MTPEGDPADDIPSPEEIRATVDRMIMSDAFSRSPQLGAFLRFVVESVLQGKSDRIKGYTIGVEVLRRDVSFDPQSDPIVRVEATRLRRTIERYYAGPGADDPVIVDLPRGSYVPTFRRRQVGGPVAGVLPGLRTWLHGTPQRWLALAAIAVVALGALGLLLLLSGRAPPVADAALTLPPGNGMPTLSVEDLAVTGTPAPGAVSAALLAEKVRDAFSRFDAINVVLDRKDVPGRHIDYRLLGSIDHLAEQTATVRFRLLDTSDDRIVWSQVFEHVSANGEIEEDKIVTALANALFQPYGVIRAHDRAKHLGSSEGYPRYRCALGTADTLRWQDRAEDERAHACLKRLTSADPSFAIGF